MRYDGFLSYATASDYQTARQVESFLESFHKLAPPAGAVIRQLQICRDGSDFKLPEASGGEGADEDPIWQIILSQLQRAKYLLVLCSPAAAKSPWVAREAAWFIENRGRDAVLALVTMGSDPVNNPVECFPKELISAGIHSGRIWYDLRGHRGQAKSSKVRDREDELVRMASDLLDWDAQAFGPLSTLWQREQLRARRRQATITIVVAGILILLAAFAIWKAIQAREDALRAHVASLVTVAGLQRDPVTSGLILNEVMSLAGNGTPYGATNLAIRVAASTRPLAVLRGHRGAVVSVVFNHRGDKMLTASQDGTARIWPADLKGPPAVFKGSGAGLAEATFSHDDKRILMADADGTARIWSTDGTAGAVILKGHTQAVRTARFSSDDSRVVTASEDGTARIWSVAGGTCLAVFRGHTGPVNSAIFNSTGNLVVTASDDGTSKTWPADGKSRPASFGFPPFQKFSSAQLSRDESEILAASSEGTGWIFSLSGRFPFITLIGGSGPVSSAAFSPDGRWIVLSQFEGLRLWEASKLTWLARTNESELSLNAGSTVRKAVFSPDSTRVAAITEDGSTHVWTIDGSTEPLVFGWHEGPVLDAAFSPDGTRIATASSDSSIRIWDTMPTREPVVVELHRGPIVGVQLDSSANRVLTRTRDGTIWLWRREGTGFASSGRSDTPFRTASLSGSGTWVVTADRDGIVRILDAATFQPVSQLPSVSISPADSPIRVVSINNSSTAIVTVSGQDSVQLWRVDGSTTPLVLKGNEGTVNSARFSPDGSRVVTTSDDKIVRVWRTDSPRDPVLFTGHQAAVRDSSFSPDGRYVVSASDDGTARIWDTTGKAPPRVLGGHPGPVFSAAFSGDGSKVVTGSSGQARVWSLDKVDEPFELSISGAGIWAVGINRDGTETFTATNDGRLFMWHTDWRWLAANIARATRACLSADQRVRLLGEVPRSAEITYRDCQLLTGQERR
jgi:WD40 repeat protein